MINRGTVIWPGCPSGHWSWKHIWTGLCQSPASWVVALVILAVSLGFPNSGHLMRRVDSLEKTLMLGGIGGRRRRVDRGWDGWMASLTQWTWVWVNSGSWWWTGRPGVLRFMGLRRVGHNWVTELNWTVPQKIMFPTVTGYNSNCESGWGEQVHSVVSL